LCFIANNGLWTVLFAENTVTGVTYRAMLQKWLLPQMSEDSEDFKFYVIFLTVHRR